MVCIKKRVIGHGKKCFNLNTFITILIMNISKKLFFIIIGIFISLPITVFALGTTSFPDVDSDSWFAHSVGYVNRQGLMTGYEDGNFGPQNPVLRAELAAILERYDKKLNVINAELQHIICLNKGNSLNELGSKVNEVEKDIYSEFLTSLCTREWEGDSDPYCFINYDAQTGDWGEMCQ